jgi:hypothetical protein
MARNRMIVSRLNPIPSRHKKNRLFNHASRNGYKCAQLLISKSVIKSCQLTKSKFVKTDIDYYP